MLKSRAALTAAFILSILATPCQAAFYKIVDRDGNVTYTDKYRPGAIKFADAAPGGPVTITLSRQHGRPSYKASPANFPKVDAATQHKRDDVRRTLLEEERRNEQRSLASARATLATAAKRPTVEQQKLAENVRLHEKNIEMLDKELARIK